jgi:hypothetical protein
LEVPFLPLGKFVFAVSPLDFYGMFIYRQRDPMGILQVERYILELLSLSFICCAVKKLTYK